MLEDAKLDPRIIGRHVLTPLGHSLKQKKKATELIELGRICWRDANLNPSITGRHVLTNL